MNWNDKSIISLEGEESNDGSLETIECNSNVLPSDVEDYLEALNKFSGVGYIQRI